MVSDLKSYRVLWISILFVLLNAALISHEIYWLLALPVAILIVSSFLFSLDKLILFIVLCTPLSFNFENLNLGGIGFYFPTEPLLFSIMIVYLIKLIHRNNFEKRMLFHPLSVLIFLHVLWIAVTCITSEMPIISLKFLLARMWFVFVIYFLGTKLFKNRKNIFRFIWLYISSLTIVVIYTLIGHSQHGFDQEAAHWVMSPFFKDHTSYGAMLAFFFPFIVAFVLRKKLSFYARGAGIALLLVFLLGLVFSYTRAAWVSLVGALFVAIWIIAKIRFRTVFILLGTFIFLFFSFQQTILMRLEKNTQDSSDNFMEHIESISNISSDASNLERLNRWNAALQMFLERPVFGWGPGTYQFQYAPFQRSKDLTIISTNFGTMGNAHSEYLGPLAESGVLGCLLFLLIAIFTLYYGIRLYNKIEDKELKTTVLVIVLGLVTYFSHGILNNYLDTDKASIPFWGFIAMLVAVDLYHRDRLENSATE